MFELTTTERQFLENLSKSPAGRDLANLLLRLKTAASDVESIPVEADQAAEVAGRKLFKKAIGVILEGMRRRDTGFGSPQELDDEEWT